MISTRSVNLILVGYLAIVCSFKSRVVVGTECDIYGCLRWEFVLLPLTGCVLLPPHVLPPPVLPLSVIIVRGPPGMVGSFGAKFRFCYFAFHFSFAVSAFVLLFALSLLRLSLFPFPLHNTPPFFSLFPLLSFFSSSSHSVPPFDA